jgi:hypothetical protein
MAPRLRTIRVNLAIPPHPRYVPRGVHVAAVGVDAVTAAYMWRATGMAVGDWTDTTRHCAALANALRAAVAAGNVPVALQAAWQVIRWGGGNQVKGAYPFLSSLGASLIPYLKNAERSFRLATADTTAISPPVIAMNSMLTKVHAFLAKDGLPIYDSRVASAAATLVEAWRQSTLSPSALVVMPIPAALHFPAVNGRTQTRVTVSRKYPTARKPARLTQYNTSSAREWSSAKIRLGWLMGEMLGAQPSVFATLGGMADRMRALEAALFMIGYDVACL